MNKHEKKYDTPLEVLRLKYFELYPEDKPHFGCGLISRKISRRLDKFLKKHEVKENATE